MSASTHVVPNHAKNPIFYRHMKRPAWGLCILAGENPSGRCYQFEDGQLRTIAPEFADRLMEEVEAPSDADTRFSELNRKLGVSATLRDDPKADARDLLTVEDQVHIFEQEYPLRFRDPAWIRDVRGLDAKRPNKRQRDPAIANAQRLLSQERMKQLIDEEHTKTLWLGFVETMRGTDLVEVKKEVRPLEDVGPTERITLSKQLQDLLYGGQEIHVRIDNFVAALRRAGIKPTWPMVTTPLALVMPKRHVVVRPAAFRRQARSLAPKLTIDNRPVGRTYVKVLAMIHALNRDLTRLGLEPRDLIAVHDFIRRTMRPNAKGRAQAPNAA